MTIETIVGGRKYRQSPTDACVVEVQHRPGARWVFYLRRDSVNEARAALLQLGREEEDALQPAK